MRTQSRNELELRTGNWESGVGPWSIDNLAAQGLMVPVLSLGTGTFGGGNSEFFQGLGREATSPTRPGWSTSASTRA